MNGLTLKTAPNISWKLRTALESPLIPFPNIVSPLPTISTERTDTRASLAASAGYTLAPGPT